ncbi:YybH family protein [Halomonas korlensis]|uniref:Ketosteroid isomerase homolog n=1 Tax=Halomonas korlensis TaxID=463301 RepID=A0A1I7IYX1_9GAMM|nr:DUF4440 domain-containing protein [Halomonas korlensis]SFU78139.1 Ketosteroid isomerase homolog [Halomonas korlensis]
MAEITGGSSVAREGIEQTNRHFEKAFNAGDIIGAVDGVYTTEARVLPPDAPMVRGHADIAHFWTAAAQQLGIQRFELSTIELDIQGDHAHEIGRATLTLGAGQKVDLKYVVVWRQEGGQWRWDIDIWNGDV